MSELWLKIIGESGRSADTEVCQKLNRFLDLLEAANQRMNLTRITGRPAAEIHHIADSLTLLPFIPADARRLADVGSGGGLPGIPLAIVLPEVQIELIESTQKKAAFLREAVQGLGLTNVGVRPARAEDVGRTDGRESFDVVTARAVGAMDLLAEYTLPLVRRGGRLLAMKGPRVAEELPAAQKMIRLLGGGPAVTHPVSLPGVEHHVVVQIDKLAATPVRFPRAPSQKGQGLR